MMTRVLSCIRRITGTEYDIVVSIFGSITTILSIDKIFGVNMS